MHREAGGMTACRTAASSPFFRIPMAIQRLCASLCLDEGSSRTTQRKAA
jgi:hypothetical protein